MKIYNLKGGPVFGGLTTPQALMDGWNLALEDILGEFLKDLSYYLNKAQQQ
jgi:hypothetical protein